MPDSFNSTSFFLSEPIRWRLNIAVRPSSLIRLDFDIPCPLTGRQGSEGNWSKKQASKSSVCFSFENEAGVCPSDGSRLVPMCFLRVVRVYVVIRPSMFAGGLFACFSNPYAVLCQPLRCILASVAVRTGRLR